MVESESSVLEASGLPGRQGRLAFVYLAWSPRRVDRDELAGVLWDELPDSWEGALNSLLSKLRRALDNVGVDGSSVLEGRSGSIELRLPSGSWVDVRAGITALDRAEGAIRRGDTRAAWADAAVASSVFRRRFLPGENGHWVERVRADLLEYEGRTFDALAQIWLAEREPVAALQAARHVLSLHPYRESAHVRVMECHVAAGNRAEAVRAYDELTGMLVDTMGLSPGPDAQQIYEQAIH